ncbi:DUF3180 domain-containing protein [Nocardioides pantholopis]|uniref:DUF3180 domain-containing protein n=1 Tax=Nocardioides pantholopis TaxID=2483798 RepID=UPI001F14BBB5|nr:DUF3180 domain-containing protein [Nocardioides pantholopis]
MRDQQPLPDDESSPPEPEGPGHLRPTSPGLLTALGVVGLVLGWLLHPVSEAVRDTAPVVTWIQPAALLLVAAILGAVAWNTWRTVHVRQERLEPRGALNRLALARACAYVGALVAGGYAGFAVSWLGIDVDLARQRALRSAVASLVALVVVGIALLLERACRIRSDDPAP